MKTFLRDGKFVKPVWSPTIGIDMRESKSQIGTTLAEKIHIAAPAPREFTTAGRDFFSRSGDFCGSDVRQHLMRKVVDRSGHVLALTRATGALDLPGLAILLGIVCGDRCRRLVAIAVELRQHGYFARDLASTRSRTIWVGHCDMLHRLLNILQQLRLLKAPKFSSCCRGRNGEVRVKL
ncbi:hypothetical protein [Loktanella sp. M215]|uniref:hypothetical protein n=1 Tax=Loktanella sp. M215 TaxID=2675431 RepID=UPI001F2E686A|nr:hypothetical protein [Loktanella sp. M215]MCF7698044.1 hypothetical protein [Loktanella sp. M215]